MSDPHQATVTVAEFFSFINQPAPASVMQMSGSPAGGTWSLGTQEDQHGVSGRWFSINSTSGLVSTVADPTSPFVAGDTHTVVVDYSVAQEHGQPLTGATDVAVISQ